jgi:glutaminyl-peptide cyclotransferase
MRRVDLETGRVQVEHRLSREWFGEGAAILGDRIYQITWLTNSGFIYSVPDLKQARVTRRSTAACVASCA